MSTTNSIFPGGMKDGVLWRIPLELSDYSKINITGGSKYGPRVIQGTPGFHYGIDMGYNCGLNPPFGAPIVASRAGKVTFAGYSSSGGNMVIVDHGDGFVTKYCHMGPAFPTSDYYKDKDQASEKANYTHIVKYGQSVTMGQKLGTIGSSGWSTGPHLHFGVEKNGSAVDPELYIFSDELIAQAKEPPSYKNWHPMFSYTPGAQDSKIGFGSKRFLHINRGFNVADGSRNLLSPHHYRDISGIGAFGFNKGAQSTINIQNALEKAEINSNYLNTGSQVTGTVYHNEKAHTISFHKSALSGDAKKAVATYIFKYLSNKGWSASPICALLGNLVGESGLNPHRWESDSPQTEKGISRGYGLTQWTPWNKYIDEVLKTLPADATTAQIQEAITDIDRQLDRIDKECTSGGGYSQYWVSKLNMNHSDPDLAALYTKWVNNIKSSNIYKNNQGGFKDYFDRSAQNNGTLYKFEEGATLAEFKTSTVSPEILAVAFTCNYEKPAGINPDVRSVAARNFYDDFAGLFDVRSNEPKSTDKYWVSEKINKTVVGVNPYPIKNNSTGFVLPNNNAYVWGRAYELMEGLAYSKGKDKVKEVELNLCEKEADWYDYNRSKGFYPFGKMPRVGSVLCWKNITTKKSHVAFVENIMGTEIINCSEYTDKNKFQLALRTNYDNNWGMDKSKYIFQGFIYLLPIEMINPCLKSETNSLQLTSSSGGMDLTSVTFGLDNLKHFNSVEVEYEVIINLPKKKNSSAYQVEGMNNYCNLYIYLTPQIFNLTEYVDSEDWKKTNVPIQPYDKNKKDSVNIIAGPFPFGLLMLRKNIVTEVGKNTYFDNKTKTYKRTFKEKFKFSDMAAANIVTASREEPKGQSTVTKTYSTNVFNTNSQEFYTFNKENPMYLGFTTVARKNQDDKDSGITVNVTRLILHK